MAAYLVQVLVRPQVAERVFIDLAASSFVEDLFAQEVQGAGSRSHLHAQPSADLDLLPKVLIGGVVHADFYEEVIASIRALASMGRRGDGKIFVAPIHSEIRESTGCASFSWQSKEIPS